MRAEEGAELVDRDSERDEVDPGQAALEHQSREPVFARRASAEQGPDRHPARLFVILSDAKERVSASETSSLAPTAPRDTRTCRAPRRPVASTPSRGTILSPEWRTG